MFGAILKATKSSFQKGMTFCIYVKKVMKLLAFIFEQPSYINKRQSDFAISREFYFHETSHMQSFAKIKSSRKFLS